MSEAPQPRIGVGVIIVRDGHILIGQRSGAHGASHWGFPGGHLEFGETPEECAHRELLEETGTILLNARRVQQYTNDVFTEKNRHYITLWVIGECVGDPKVTEPDKCLGWEWHEWDNLPDPVFLPIENLKIQGYHPIESQITHV
ncbi:NUDIX domain-containing protein [Candidatus Uhrbacteria bacterium]|jgi:8-oxo-dGTP diphosphatase|nr:NUDIX domain-containing protein [Candidatus Uhrbacteria bacterium]